MCWDAYVYERSEPVLRDSTLVPLVVLRARAGQSLHDYRYIRKMLNSGWQKLGVEEVPAQKQQLRVYKLQEEHRHWRPYSAKHEIIIDSPEEAERKAVLRRTQQEALRNQMEVPDHQDY